MMSYFANEFSQKYKNDNEQLTTRLAEVENENMRRQAEIAQLQERSVQLQEINVQLQDRNTELMYITQEYQNVEEDISPKRNIARRSRVSLNDCQSQMTHHQPPSQMTRCRRTMAEPGRRTHEMGNTSTTASGPERYYRK
ncbi:hypothetical protein JTE90_017577 [Oedothorax gibbosus]|uniref:Uncharacterized protein n=1 Tax=Oedothorax gibbosus TaxID=931172 RepID=A0AAV6TLQ1_9ARAC|nr:hypothetical protein JTE90_017577 [Oedothorax gibbosus]